MPRDNETMEHLSILEYLDKIAKTKANEDISIIQDFPDKNCEILSAVRKTIYPEKLF